MNVRPGLQACRAEMKKSCRSIPSVFAPPRQNRFPGSRCARHASVAIDTRGEKITTQTYDPLIFFLRLSLLQPRGIEGRDYDRAFVVQKSWPRAGRYLCLAGDDYYFSFKHPSGPR